MPDYRIYVLDREGHIRMAQAICYQDDLDALAETERLSRRESIEIWEGSRIVARVNPNSAPLSTNDHKSL